MQNATVARPIAQFPSARNRLFDQADLICRKLLSCKKKKLMHILQNYENDDNAPVPDVSQTAVVKEFERCWRRLIFCNFI